MAASTLTGGQQHLKSPKVLVDEIEEHIRKALDVLFTRAAPQGKLGAIVDEKKSLPGAPPVEGVLQDCEFGLILLLARDWLKTRENGLRGTSLANDATVEEVVRQLVERTLEKLLKDDPRWGNENEKAGRGNRIVFFSGDPYTQTKGEFTSLLCPANLDAAMLTVAFLSAALKTYPDGLRTPYKTAGIENAPNWIASLRDAALFACLEGIRYAEDCRIIDTAGKFDGFTCEPDSKPTSDFPGDRKRLSELDRLFYTWTACETISDLVDWLPFLGDLKPPPPKEIVKEISERVRAMQKNLVDAAEWCDSKFAGTFLNLQGVPVSQFVASFERARKKGNVPAALMVKLREVQSYVQNVYHISQYAAIRSLSTAGFSVKEVADLFGQLDKLVRIDILGDDGVAHSSDSDVNWKLDASEEENLFKTLTRKYSLGLASRDDYSDDAYYPLVVRSLAIVLLRTIEGPGKGSAAELSSRFGGILQYHYEKLLERSPARGGPGEEFDGLWSFAKGAPYVFYATQRTLFALLQYKDCLEVIDRVTPPPPPPQYLRDLDPVEQKTCDLLAASLATALVPAIKEFVSLARSVSRTEPEEFLFLLPKPAWAAEPIREWLRTFANDFDSLNFADHLLHKAQTLKTLYQWISKLTADDLDPKQMERLESIRLKFQELMTHCGLTNKIEFEDKELVRHLFEDLFTELVIRAAGPLKDWIEGENCMNPKGKWSELLKDAATFKTTVEARPKKEGLDKQKKGK